MDLEYEIFWEGRIHADQIHWKLDKKNQLLFNEENEKKRNEIWAKTVQEYPTSYDGELTRLIDFKIKKNHMDISLGIMKFSQSLTMYQYNFDRFEKFGQIGIAAIILDQTNDRILVGRRTSKTMYRPLHYAIPGGILESSDISGTIEEACLRELKEEILVDNIQFHNFRLVSIIENIDRIGTQCIVEVHTNYDNENDVIPANEEWEGNELYWVSRQNLEIYNQRVRLADLDYAIQSYQL